MSGTTLQLLIAGHLAIMAVVLLRPRPVRPRGDRRQATPAPVTPLDQGTHLRAVADRMFDEADLLLAEADDRRLLGLDGDAAELRDRASEIEAVTYLVIEEARRLLGQRPPRWPSEDGEPAT
ncbi:hypothetical protein [Nitriliruptor alkaliphilus]|uniref:hypothetical protein n=1 Tax=Nitriliruptor alkaliphilus TaxID=427918 RepID=UPI000697D9DB|nr:hypothetical protein [Nitriliruptor alkaliphilus]